MKGESMARQVGQRKIQPYHIKIAKPKGTVLYSDGVRRNGVSQPYMPDSLLSEYHPGGNSLCYTIQTAHLMGAGEIFLLGFTLKSGSRYFFGTEQNPVTKRSSVYDTQRAVDWLSWFEKAWPGRARLVEGWDGPAYEVLQTISHEELHAKFCKPKPDTEWLV